MALTDTRIRNAKPTSKPFKLSDGGGIYLLVKPDGARYWRPTPAASLSTTSDALVGKI
jgi:hypothetical protein